MPIRVNTCRLSFLSRAHPISNTSERNCLDKKKKRLCWSLSSLVATVVNLAEESCPAVSSTLRKIFRPSAIVQVSRQVEYRGPSQHEPPLQALFWVIFIVHFGQRIAGYAHVRPSASASGCLSGSLWRCRSTLAHQQPPSSDDCVLLSTQSNCPRSVTLAAPMLPCSKQWKNALNWLHQCQHPPLVVWAFSSS